VLYDVVYLCCKRLCCLCCVQERLMKESKGAEGDVDGVVGDNGNDDSYDIVVGDLKVPVVCCIVLCCVMLCCAVLC